MKGKIFLIFTIVTFFLLSGCGMEEFSRYPSIEVPKFAQEDYYNLLSNRNPEVVYNAICNLGPLAEDMGETLSDKEIDKNSQEYLMASNIYKKITSLLSTRDARIVAASLRFLQLFSNKYKAQKELLEPILRIKSNNWTVQYEQVIALSRIAQKDSPIPESLVRKFLKSHSWLVSRSAYLLVDSLEHAQLREELIKQYRRITDEKEQLLILTAFKEKFNNSVANFLLDEVLLTQSLKIQHTILAILGNSEHPDKVLEWIRSNYERISFDNQRYLFDFHVTSMGERFSSELICIFLEKGFTADEEFLQKLNKILEAYISKKKVSGEDRNKLNNLMRIEEVILANEGLAIKWETVRNKTKQIKAQLEKMQSEYTPIMEDFISKTDNLFKRYNVSDEKRKEFLKEVSESKENLIEDLIQ